MQYRDHEIIAMAKKAKFAAFLTCHRFGQRFPATDIAAIADRLPHPCTLIVFGPEPTSTTTDRNDLPPSVVRITPTAADECDRARVRHHLTAGPNDANDCLTICWTSGTESAPKGVLRCHLDWLAISWATVDAPRLTSQDVLLNAFPMVNMAGINGMLLPWLRTGAVLVQHHPMDLPTWLHQVATEHITYTVAPPSLLQMLLHDPGLHTEFDLTSLTRVGSGSAPLQPAMVRAWQEGSGSRSSTSTAQTRAPPCCPVRRISPIPMSGRGTFPATATRMQCGHRCCRSGWIPVWST
jgi:acyl-coenzyme A synthetase/AMP-(fatty) acid ligase